MRLSKSSGSFCTSLGLRLFICVAIVCFLAAPTLAQTPEPVDTPAASPESTVFLIPSKGEIWDGSCTGVSNCSATSPCSLPDAPIVVNSADTCVIVFTTGNYSKVQIASAKKLHITSAGFVTGLQLLASTNDFCLSSYPLTSEEGNFVLSRIEQQMSATNVNKLTVQSVTLLDTQVLASSDQPIHNPVNVTLARYVVISTSDDVTFDAVFSVTAPESSNGVISVEMAYVQTIGIANTTGLFYTTLAYPQITAKSINLDGGDFFLNLTRPQNAKVHISGSYLQNFNILIAEPLTLGRVWTSENAVALKVYTSYILGTARSLSAIGMWDTCVDVISVSSVWKNVVINCNDYNANREAENHCDVSLSGTDISDSNVCFFGTATNDSTIVSENRFQFDQTTISYTAARPHAARTDFRNVFIQKYQQEEEGNSLILKDLTLGTNADPPVAYVAPFIFTGYVGFDNFITLRTNSLSLTKSTLEVTNLMLTGKAALHAASVVRARGIKPSWSLVAPLIFTSGVTTVSTVDVSAVANLSLAFDEQATLATRPVVQLQNTVLYATDAAKLADSLSVSWGTFGMPVASHPYALANFTLAEGQSLQTGSIKSPSAEIYNFDLAPQVVDAASNTWTAFAVWNHTRGTTPCRKPMPNLPGFLCDPKTLYWTAQGDYYITNATLNVPPFSKYRISGDLILNNGTLNFQGEANELSVDGCVSWIGKKKLTADFTQKGASFIDFSPFGHFS